MKRIFFIGWMLLVFLFSCKSKKEKVRDLLEQGADSSQAGHYAAAIDLYNKAIASDPWLKKGFYLRGVTNIQAGEYKGAMEDLERAEKLLSNGSGYIMQKNNILKPEDNFWEVDYHDLLYHKAVASVYLDSLVKAYRYFDYLIRNQYRETSRCFLWKGEILLGAGDSVNACTEFMNAKLAGIEPEDRNLAADYLMKVCKDKLNPDTLLFYKAK